MAQAAIGAHVEMALNVTRHITAQVAFDLVALIDDRADLDDVVIRKRVGLEIEADPRLAEDLPRQASADAVNVSHRHFHAFGPGQIYSSNTRHKSSLRSEFQISNLRS